MKVIITYRQPEGVSVERERGGVVFCEEIELPPRQAMRFYHERLGDWKIKFLMITPGSSVVGIGSERNEDTLLNAGLLYQAIPRNNDYIPQFCVIKPAAKQDRQPLGMARRLPHMEFNSKSAKGIRLFDNDNNVLEIIFV